MYTSYVSHSVVGAVVEDKLQPRVLDGDLAYSRKKLGA
jgi:hypothetical protein